MPFVPSSTPDQIAGLINSLSVPAENALPDVTKLRVSDTGAALTVPTGYANNEVVEPSMLYDERAPFFADSSGGNGYAYVLCAAPYPASDATKENPCLWVSHDGTTWLQVVFTNGIGAVNTGAAVVATPIIANGVQGDGNLSDPYLCRDTSGNYYIIFNQFLNATPAGTGTGGNDWATKVTTAKSLAGPWTTPVTAIAQVRGTRRDSCPAAYWDGSLWHIYCINLANLAVQAPVTYYTAASLASTWTVGANPTLALPAAYSTRTWWHLTVYYWSTGVLLIIQDNIIASSGAGNLWAVWSGDGGVTWTVPNVPMLALGVWYRAAAIITTKGRALGLDLFTGLLNTTWQLCRQTATFEPLTYADVGGDGVPNHAAAVNTARLPVTPYTLGDTANRVDSAVTASPSDSGLTYTAVGGTWGIATKQIYVAVSAGNNKLVGTTIGSADCVAGCEFSVCDTAIQQYFIVRYVDTNNFVRIGYATTGQWKMENIVAGVVSQTVTNSFGLKPTNNGSGIITVVCSVSTITVYLDGVKIMQATGWTSNAAGTGVGYQSNGTSNCRWRNVYSRPLVNGT